MTYGQLRQCGVLSLDQRWPKCKLQAFEIILSLHKTVDEVFFSFIFQIVFVIGWRRRREKRAYVHLYGGKEKRERKCLSA